MNGIQRIIYDTENEFSWTSIQTAYDTAVGGGVRSTRSLFDDTHEEFGTYEDGILVQTYVVDADNAFTYSNKNITYDETGNIAEIGTVFGDYTRLTSRFIDGNLVNTLNPNGFYDSPYLSFGDIHKASTEYVLDFNNGVNVTDGDQVLDCHSK